MDHKMIVRALRYLLFNPILFNSNLEDAYS